MQPRALFHQVRTNVVPLLSGLVIFLMACGSDDASRAGRHDHDQAKPNDGGADAADRSHDRVRTADGALDGDAGGRRDSAGAQPGVAKTCSCGDYRTCEVGPVFADGCNYCQCRSDGRAICTAALCTGGGAPADGGAPPSSRCLKDSDCGPHGTCVYDRGCERPGGTCYLVNGRPGGTPGIEVPQTYCGCDGRSFTADAPAKPYRSVGACP